MLEIKKNICMSSYIKPTILVCPNEGIQMRLPVQLSYQRSSMQPQIVDDLPRAEESNKNE